MSNQSNAHLCRAVQQYPCIYDHAIGSSVTREAYDRAWLEVAKSCEETVGTCKQRWRTIRTTFARSLVGTPKKRKGNRAREQNLHDLLEFLIPHLNNGTNASPFCESDDDAEGVTMQTQKNAEETKNTKAEDGLLEELVIKREIVELKGDKKNELEIKVREESYTADDKADIASKRPPYARLKVLRKTSVDVKVTETKAAKKGQYLEKTVNAEEDLQNMDEVRLAQNSQISKSKVGTFYISPPNSDAGTFYIKQHSNNNELEETTEREANMTNDESVLYECELNESTQPKSEVEDPIKTRQCRLKRACKRGFGKKTITKRDLRQKDTGAKSVKRNTAHLKSLGEATKQLITVTKLAKKTGTTMPVETQTTNFASATRTRTLCIPQGDTINVGSQQRKSLSPVIKLARYDANSAQENIDQSVQCNIQQTSSDNDFFDTLKPYLSEMNARQKLHFKKKIYESLMEVFDSTSDFPANDQSKAFIPKQLSAVSGDELHLVRELVAMVQAAKHTPELNLNLSSGSGYELANKLSTEKCAVISPTVAPRSTATQPTPLPPLSLRVSPFNTNTTSANSLTNKSKPTLHSSAIATSTQTTATTPSSPLVHRRFIRKLVKVNELGAATACNMPTTSAAYAPSNSELLHRRVYRIFPKSGVNNVSLENAVNASSVGTFIVPRSTAEAAVHSIATGSQLANKASTARTFSTAINQKVTPVSGSSVSQVSLVSPTGQAGRNPPTIRVGARPLMRRYSVCGALQNFNVEQSTASSNYLTTTANTKSTVSTTPKITIAHRCSPANVAGREVFKLPTPFRSTITSANAIVAGVATNTTTSRTTPLVSVSAGDRHSAVRTVPFNMGFNKCARNDEKTTVTYPTVSASNAKALRDSSSSSHVVGNKRPLATSSEIVGKRNRPYNEKRIEGQAVEQDLMDMSVIASDEFDILNIKTEPADDVN